ncbi:MAG: hypothetical protein H6708_02650 [Kofleriaceae bacterium]|nr:hypothetical protein [Kofleriaceae bacterium]
MSELERDIRDQPLARPVDIGDVRGQQALEVYTRMAIDETGAAASAGYYGMAWVQLDRGRDNDALRALTTYQSRFPKGDEGEAVRWMELRIRCLRKVDDACRRAAHTYIEHDGGDGPRGRIASRVTAAH